MTADLLEIERSLPTMAQDRLVHLLTDEMARLEMCRIEFEQMPEVKYIERIKYTRELWLRLNEEATRRYLKLIATEMNRHEQSLKTE